MIEHDEDETWKGMCFLNSMGLVTWLQLDDASGSAHLVGEQGGGGIDESLHPRVPVRGEAKRASVRGLCHQMACLSYRKLCRRYNLYLSTSMYSDWQGSRGCGDAR